MFYYLSYFVKNLSSKKFMIYKYLSEIKYRTFFSFVTWSFLTLNCYFSKETLLYVFVKFSSISKINDSVHFLITDITEVFMTYLQLSYLIANQITFVFIYYQLFAFISGGLYKFEYIYLKNTSIVILAYWVAFIFIINYTIFPASWNFFLQFQSFMTVQDLTFYFEAKLNEYWAFYKTVYTLCFLVYQVLILFWIFLNLFKTNFLLIRKLRKILYFSFVIAGTIITPPDVIHQLISSICIIMVYELILGYTLLKIEFMNLS